MTNHPDSPPRGGPVALVAHGRHVRIASLLQLIDMEAVSGVLSIPGLGTVAFSQGRVVRAEVDGLRGVEAVLELLLMDPRVEFTVRVSEIDEGGQALGTTPSLVLEGSQRADDWARVEVLVYRTHGDSPETSDPRASRLWKSIDGERGCVEILTAARVSRAFVARTLTEWWAEDRISVVREAAPHPQPQTTSNAVSETFDFYACLDGGRQSLRQGLVEQAIQYFQRAVEHKPSDRVASQNLRRALHILEMDPA